MENNLMEMNFKDRAKYYGICWLKGIPAGLLTSLKMYGVFCLFLELFLWIAKRHAE